jgi:hypothetical protein
MDKKELAEWKNILLDHCYNLGILRRSALDKKKDSILDSLIISIIRANLTIDDIKECIKDVNKNEVINIKFFKKGGNLFKDYVNPKWLNFAKELFRQRTVGLGTPNAASGEGELMFLFLSKNISKPTRGDLKIDDEIIELKGDVVRVMGEIRGKEFRKKTLSVCEEFNLTPNKANTTNLDAVEIEKFQHLNHWKKELAKLSLQKQKEFIAKWLSCLDDEKHEDSVSKIFNQGTFDHEIFIKEIVKILYSVTVESGNFDKFVILGNGENAKIISKDVEDFNKKIDNGEIITQSDYFRINQQNNIGWYIV